MKLCGVPSRARGTVLLVVLALLAVMAVLMLSVTQTLFSMKRELRLIEKKQVQRYEMSADPGGRQ